MWGAYKRFGKPVNGEEGEKQVQRECLANADGSAPCWRFWHPAPLWLLLFLRPVVQFSLSTSLYNQEILCLYILITNMVFTVDTNKLLTVPFFLSSLFPIPHHTTTQIICLKCKFHHSIVLLQNGSSRMVSQSYIGFQDSPRPASSVCGLCGSPHQLCTHRAPQWVHSLHPGVLPAVLSTWNSLSPPAFHLRYGLPGETLYHPARARSSSRKPSLASQTEMSSFPFELSLWQVQHSLNYFSNCLFISLPLLSFFLKVWPEEQVPQKCLSMKSTNTLLLF